MPAACDVKIAWTNDQAPCWEIVTRHGGFADPPAAAFFANGFSEHGDAPLVLELRDDAAWLRVGSASPARLEEANVEVSKLRDDGGAVQIAEAGEFEPSSLGDILREFTYLELRPILYVVLEEGQALDVTIREEGDLVAIRALDESGEADSSDDGVEEASISVGIVPRA